MTRFVSENGRGGGLGVILGTVIFAVNLAAPAAAQNTAIDDLRGKIFDAKMAQQLFAAGLKHCSELNGTNFYFQPRDRVLNLEDYHRSLERLAQGGGFNPETKRPWSQEDANLRWTLAQQEAVKDQADCALVSSLPDLQKKLQELQQAAATQDAPPPNK